MNIGIIIVMALMALLVMGLVWSMAAKENTTVQRPKRLQGMRRNWRKLYLMPLGVQRLIGWLPGQTVRPAVQFANVGEGSWDHGKKSYLPDAATNARYLLYKRGTDVNHCAICGAGDDPLGPSDDQAGADGVPIAVNILGACKGTLRIVTDGSLADGDYVKCGAAGKGTKAANGDLSFGRAVITTDMSSGDGEVIGLIPVMPAKYAF